MLVLAKPVCVPDFQLCSRFQPLHANQTQTQRLPCPPCSLPPGAFVPLTTISPGLPFLLLWHSHHTQALAFASSPQDRDLSLPMEPSPTVPSHFHLSLTHLETDGSDGQL